MKGGRPPKGAFERPLQRAQAIRVGLALVGGAERLGVAQEGRVHRVGDAPEIREPVLDRRSREGDAEFGLHGLGGIHDADAGRLHLLGLVEQDRGELDPAEVAVVVARGLVGSQHPVGLLQALRREPRRAVEAPRLQRGKSPAGISSAPAWGSAQKPS